MELEAGGATKAIAVVSLLAGIALALLAAVCASAAIVLIQAYASKLSISEMMAGFLLPMVAVTLVLALSIEGTNWAWLTSLDTYGWGVLLVASLVAAPLGILWVTVSIRKVGANAVALLMSLRLVAALIGQRVLPPYVLLTSGLVIAGVVLIMAAVSGYFALQVWLSARQQAQQAISTEPKEQQQH
jgi:drug/metabolite transporter (DMT)-like permease